MSRENGTVRQSNMELLRILAMLMIITLHYLDKGDVLSPFSQIRTVNHSVGWIIEALCYVSVNIYVLISGYFLVYSRFSFQKIAVLWFQVLCYSWLIGAVFILSGMIKPDALNLYELIFIAFPVTSGHYWFATIYILLFAICPFLNAAIQKMNRKQHMSCIMVLLLIFSAWNTLLPFTIPVTDHAGMDIAWFVCLYMIAAYLRKYPDCMEKPGYLYCLGYLFFSLSIFVMGLALVYVDSVTGKLGGYATNWYAYNSLPVLLASVCLFIAFTKITVKGKRISNMINTFAGATFGVYLLHEHRYMRYEWPKWFLTEQNAEKPWMLLHLIGSVLCVFAICAVVELIRKGLFSLITGQKWFAKLFYHFEKPEHKINGEEE